MVATILRALPSLAKTKRQSKAWQTTLGVLHQAALYTARMATSRSKQSQRERQADDDKRRRIRRHNVEHA